MKGGKFKIIGTSCYNCNNSWAMFDGELKQLSSGAFEVDGFGRYYDEKSINLLKKVKFLLKEQGMTINGVKKVLTGNVSFELDEMANNSIKADNLKNKLTKISNIIKNLKNLKQDGKKNTR